MNINCMNCTNCATYITAEHGSTPRCNRRSELFEAIMFELRMHITSGNWMCTSEDPSTSREAQFETEFSEETGYEGIEGTFEQELLNDISGHIINLEDEVIEDELLSAGFDWIESLGATKFTDGGSRWEKLSVMFRRVGELVASDCRMFTPEDRDDEIDIVLAVPMDRLTEAESVRTEEERTYDTHIDSLAYVAMMETMVEQLGVSPW